MSQTNLDYLFSVASSTSDRGATLPRSGNDSTGFDDHLNQASTTVVDPFHLDAWRSASSVGSSNGDRYGSSSRDSNSTDSKPRPSESSSRPSDNSTASSSTPASSTDSCERTEDSDKADNSDNDSHKTDEADDSAATSLAGAAQATGKNATEKQNDAAHKEGGNASTETKVAEKSKHAKSKVDSKPEATNSKPDGKASDATAKVVDAVNEKIAAGTAEAAAKADGDAAEEAQPATAAASNEHTATKRNAAEHGKVEVDGAKQAEQHQAKSAEATADVAGAVESASAESQKKAAAAKVGTTTKANGADAATDDDSKPGGKTTSRNDSRADATAAAGKADAAAIANNVAANITDATDKSGGSNESDKAVKPVAVKAETSVGPLGRALRAATDITRGAQTKGADELPPVDPSRFVGRVAKAFQTANERGGTLQLRLSPPELGSLKIQLTVKDGVMSASLEAANETSRRVLLEHLPALRDRLADQNIRIDKFDVDVKQENSGGQANPQGSHQNQQRERLEQLESRRSGGAQQRPPVAAEVELPTIVPSISSTGINLVV